MLTLVRVRNFQSLRRADVPLGRLTVITGPTGSGKSALFRALLLLARNARGTSYISGGAASCSVTAGDGRWAVRIARSSAPRGRNEYQVARWDGGAWQVTERHTKLAGAVPSQVTALTGLSPLNFARQFDPPFLLSLPGTAIARQLGELTNVSLVFGAAAEANRRRKGLQRDLDGARARHAALLAEMREFDGLQERRKAAAAAESALERLQELDRQVKRLTVLTDRLEAAEDRLTAAEQATASAPPPAAAVPRAELAAAVFEDGGEAVPALCPACGRPLS